MRFDGIWGWLGRRMPPPPDPRGQVCHCGQPATEQFYAGMCADTSPRQGTWIPLCVECDIQMNKLSLRILYGDTSEVREMIETYAREKRSQTDG